MSDLTHFMRQPPRCLDSFKVESMPDGLAGIAFDGHGEEWNPVFALSCGCGSREFRLRGYPVAEPEYSLFLSPLEATCAACANTAPLLDTDVHGYDAELGHGSGTRRAEGQPGHFACPACSGEKGALFMRFEFTQDLFDGSFDDVPVAKEDLFSWVTCVSQCSGCNQRNVASDFECA